MSLFELEAVGGAWSKRMARRRGDLDMRGLDQLATALDPVTMDRARFVWTQSAFSEYASAASFAAIAGALLRAGAPIDLVAAAGEFVVDEMIHAELSASVASALGGAVALEVDLARLVRPAETTDPLLEAAVLLVRTSCVGEALTVPILRSALASAGSPALEAILARILKDESAHAEIGPWFLDWAAPRLSDQHLALLGRVAGEAVRSFAPVFGGACAGDAPAGVLGCDTFDAAFAGALRSRVVAPLRDRGIEFPAEDLSAIAVSG